MRTAILLLAILLPSAAVAREGDKIVHTTAEYLAAYGKARTYALAHIGQARQPSCRKAIGKRPAQVIEQRCLDVSASSRTSCTRTDACESLIDMLEWHCGFWQGDVACIYPQDGGAVVAPNARPTWRPKAL